MSLQAISYNPDKYSNPKKYEYTAIINTNKLFDFLHELKIDYRGLIDAKLAIDANTLGNNFYE
jgi:hypothetical protein